MSKQTKQKFYLPLGSVLRVVCGHLLQSHAVGDSDSIFIISLQGLLIFITTVSPDKGHKEQHFDVLPFGDTMHT